MKLILTIGSLLLIATATQVEGLYRALAELSAFLFIAALVIHYRKEKRQKVRIEPEEL
ncbi:hypothetical protein VII00023_18829 [Vibrio ichthyoenteri ATCC 700023]|uniref:O-succinylbenzoic acid--CoA ligase n=1 Tax=Vibrio ichthyoenteri ATCC 700023 TaxID=870968 RepID=F9RZ83_9VIBR|nr:hypothetical protein [Vibrio ichthyoenteri]EGU45707.1 hypothetical protein VII00023_18829 [Vibrio ichthyoenteri ATCC 700023]